MNDRRVGGCLGHDVHGVYFGEKIAVVRGGRLTRVVEVLRVLVAQAQLDPELPPGLEMVLPPTTETNLKNPHGSTPTEDGTYGWARGRGNGVPKAPQWHARVVAQPRDGSPRRAPAEPSG